MYSSYVFKFMWKELVRMGEGVTIFPSKWITVLNGFDRQVFAEVRVDAHCEVQNKYACTL